MAKYQKAVRYQNLATQRKHPLQQIVNAIVYVTKTGI